MMYKLDDYIVSPTMTIVDAMARLDMTLGIGLIVADIDRRLLGTLTDGDIRRAILSGAKLDDCIDMYMHRSPFYAHSDASYRDLCKISEEKSIFIIPILSNGVISDLFMAGKELISNIPAVIMAGGLGTRLGEHTKYCPKPMLEVGGKPVLERIVEKLVFGGIKKIYISVNYLAEQIEEYFGDGEKFDAEIIYLKEDRRLGTAGALSLLNSQIEGPLIVLNGDLVTDVDYRRLLYFHHQNAAPMTMCIRNYEFQVPYGVVNLSDNGFLDSLSEKPRHVFYVNAGLYVIDSTLLRYIPKEEFFDMNSFMGKVIEGGDLIKCFLLHEEWVDIGQIPDLEKARKVFVG